MTRLERLLLRWFPLAIGNDDDLAELGTNQSLKIMSQMNRIGGLEPDKPLIQFNTMVTDGTTTFADLLREATTPNVVIEGTTNGHAG